MGLKGRADLSEKRLFRVLGLGLERLFRGGHLSNLEVLCSLSHWALFSSTPFRVALGMEMAVFGLVGSNFAQIKCSGIPASMVQHVVASVLVGSNLTHQHWALTGCELNCAHNSEGSVWDLVRALRGEKRGTLPSPLNDG